MFNSIDAMGTIKSKGKLVVRGQKAKVVKREPELLEQAALVEWAAIVKINGYRIGDYLVHVPNEGKRGPKAAGDFKKAGGKKGYPDLILDIPSGAFHGLRIEMKSKDGKPTTEQMEWIERLRDIGYRAEICYSFDEARQLIERYLIS